MPETQSCQNCGRLIGALEEALGWQENTVCNECYSRLYYAANPYSYQTGADPAVSLVKPNAPGATASLVCGLVGLLVAGIILGIIAVVKARKARELIRAHPSHYGGRGMATAGLVLGIIDIISSTAVLLLWAAGSM